MANIQLSVDLGSKFITICQKDVGLVLREPCIAIAQKTKDRYELREVGFRAESIISTALGGARVVCPVQEGFIVDEEMFTLLLKEFFKKILPSSFIKPRVKAIVSITSAMTNSDRRVVEKCFISAGIKEVILVESPLSMLAYTGSIGGMFVDIGAGKTEIASVTNRGIASAVSVNIAGEAFNNAIIDSLQKHYGVKLGAYTVEKMKKNALSFYLNDEGRYIVTGTGSDGVPAQLSVSAEDMRDAVLPLVDDIIEVIMSVLQETPPELSAEILRKGIFMSGGSTYIPGLVDYMEQALELPITVVTDVENAVALGGIKFFDDMHYLGNLLGIRLD
ncbi:MAG: rod shape-determining protein [Clostridia bacterium]|nr:rod shape-determining protein [Clostridia bacterium]